MKTHPTGFSRGDLQLIAQLLREISSEHVAQGVEMTPTNIALVTAAETVRALLKEWQADLDGPTE